MLRAMAGVALVAGLFVLDATSGVRDHAPAFKVTLDVFRHAGLITKRRRCEDVIVAPPG